MVKCNFLVFLLQFVHRTHQQHQEHFQQQQPQSAAVKREVDTSTGSMLTAPFNPRTAAYPPAPPQPFNKLYSVLKQSKYF
jgi:hypothetical protein